jgi:crotonobetainyl-CoA:carnitine CoA-transferase CaiB-like acyl-CoA transferase
VRNAKALALEIENALSKKSAKEWVQELCSAGVPAEEVLQPEALLKDPQAAATEMLLPYPDGSTELDVIPGLPLRFDGVRPPITKAAPHRD